MKKLFPLTILLTIIFFTPNGLAQRAHEKFTGHLRTGSIIINKTDLPKSDFDGNRPDLFVSGGLSYRIDVMDADLVGDLMFGTIDGSGDSSFFNTVFYDASLNVRFDVLKWFMDSDLELSPFFGVGLLFYNARKYDLETRNLIVESPRPEDKALSPNPSANFGIELSYPIMEKFSFAIGYNHKLVFGNDYFDVTLLDKPFDNMGIIQGGFIFDFGGKLGSKRGKRRKGGSSRSNEKEGIVELTNQEYAELVFRIDSLKSKLAKADLNSVESLREKVDEQEVMLDSMDIIIDSLRAGVVDFFPLDSNEALQSIGNATYHLVLSSSNSRAQAQEFIDRAVTLEQDQMFIMEIPNEERYIILYKSYKNLQKARKEKSQLRNIAPGAWIARI